MLDGYGFSFLIVDEIELGKLDDGGSRFVRLMFSLAATDHLSGGYFVCFFGENAEENDAATGYDEGLKSFSRR